MAWPADRPINAAPTGVRTETRFRVMSASCGYTSTTSRTSPVLSSQYRTCEPMRTTPRRSKLPNWSRTGRLWENVDGKLKVSCHRPRSYVHELRRYWLRKRSRYRLCRIDAPEHLSATTNSRVTSRARVVDGRIIIVRWQVVSEHRVERIGTSL